MWSTMTPTGTPPEPRHGHIAVAAFNNIIIFGGRGNDNKIYNDIFILDTAHQKWIKPKVGGDIPSGRYYHASCVIEHSTAIIMFGGIKPKGLPSLPRVYILTAGAEENHELNNKEECKDEAKVNNIKPMRKVDSLWRPDP